MSFPSKERKLYADKATAILRNLSQGQIDSMQAREMHKEILSLLPKRDITGHEEETFESLIPHNMPEKRG